MDHSFPGTNGPENENSIMGTNVQGNELLRTNVPDTISGWSDRNPHKIAIQKSLAM